MQPVIQVQNLTKQYKNTRGGALTRRGQNEPRNAVDDISFTVNEGEFFAFLGANGAGKTTTISILTTTLSKTSGDARIAGYDVERDAKKFRASIGIIFQKPSLDFDLSAEENIRLHVCMYCIYRYRPFFKWMPKSYRDRIVELAELLGVKDGLWKPLKVHSGGMQRKIEIIRSLMHRPAVLFLDEPTQGLDAVSRRSLWEYINETRKQYGTTVFLTTHYIDEAEGVDRLAMINKGKIIFSGTPAELKGNHGQKSLEDAYINLLTEGGAA